MKKSKFLAAALAATMFATAACGLVACDKDAAPVIPGGTDVPSESQSTEYTVTFSGLTGTNATQTTVNGKLATLPKPTTIPEGKEFKGWATTQSATSANVTTSYTFAGTNTNVTVYPVYADKQQEEEDPPTPPIPEEYTITFSAGAHGTLDGTAEVTTTDGKASFPNVDPDEGWIFDHWEDADGNTVTASTVFTKNITVTAQYEEEEEDPDDGEESDGELLVNGTRKLYLTDNTEFIQAPVEGATATYEYYATGVELNAGDVVTFRIKGVVLVHHNTPAEGDRLWDTATRHGVTFNQAEGTFTVKASAGSSFDIYVRYYDTGEGNTEHPCWSIEFTDGEVDSLVAGGMYLVGTGFANATFGLDVENYIDPDEGLVVTFNAGNEIKACHCGQDGTSQVWDMGDNSLYTEVGGNYLDFSTLNSGMGNGSCKSGPHTYKITLSGDGLVFTLID